MTTTRWPRRSPAKERSLDRGEQNGNTIELLVFQQLFDLTGTASWIIESDRLSSWVGYRMREAVVLRGFRHGR